MNKKINTYVIPVLNNYKGLARLLETLEKYTDPNYKVIVINNGCTLPGDDGDTEYLHKARKVTDLWIAPSRNLGFGKAMNLGIKLADTEFVTLANDDVEIIYRGWWDEVMERFKEEPALGGYNPHSPCNKASDGNRYIQYPYKKEYNKEDVEEMKAIFTSEREYVGCCTYFTICKKEMFNKIGLFDESFGLGSGEDYDLCVRAFRGGYRIKGGSKTMVFHWWGNTKDNMPKLDGKQQSNFDLIAGGNQNMERKWGKHIDKDPKGWSVAGSGGPEKPLDQETAGYKDDKWYQEVPL